MSILERNLALYLKRISKSIIFLQFEKYYLFVKGLKTMATAKKTTEVTDVSEEPNYEEAVAELEQLISEMESGKMSLEANLAAYKRGTQLIKLCQKRLDQVEQQVKIFEAE
jgi:exodeoxyribonuclease VII small subunit